jgi:hypothetical protein
MMQDNQDADAMSCVQCGHVIYAEAPAAYEPDRRSQTDNRQEVAKPFNEYRQAMTEEEFEEEFGDIISEGPS